MSDRFENSEGEQKEFVESGAKALLDEFKEYMEKKKYMGDDWDWDGPMVDLTGLPVETVDHFQRHLSQYFQGPLRHMMMLLGAWLGKRHATAPKAKATSSST